MDRHWNRNKEYFCYHDSSSAYSLRGKGGVFKWAYHASGAAWTWYPDAARVPAPVSSVREGRYHDARWRNDQIDHYANSGAAGKGKGSGSADQGYVNSWEVRDAARGTTNRAPTSRPWQDRRADERRAPDRNAGGSGGGSSASAPAPWGPPPVGYTRQNAAAPWRENQDRGDDRSRDRRDAPRGGGQRQRGDWYIGGDGHWYQHW